MSIQSRKEAEVWQACDFLTKNNTKLTYKAIGDTLVDLGFRRGSNSDIYRYLSTWRQQHAPDTPASSPEQLDFEDMRHFQGALDKIQTEIWSQANQTIALLKTEYHGLHETLQSQLAALPTASGQPVESMTADIKETIEAQLSQALSENGAVLAYLREQFQDIVKAQECSMLKLYEHHQLQFEQYMSALEHLRQANTLLSNQMASMRATQSAQLQERDKELAATKEALSREKKKRMMLERQRHVQPSALDTERR